MIGNKRGEEMVEAAMVLPLLILVCVSLLMVMVWYYDVHQNQITIHRDLLIHARESDDMFRVKKQAQQDQTILKGMAGNRMTVEKQHRVYWLKPAQWIRLGEMAGLDDG